jgi:hypothetical protein
MRRLAVLASTLSLLLLPGIQAHANAGSGIVSLTPFGRRSGDCGGQRRTGR